MSIAIPVKLSIPADGPLGPALLAEVQKRQRAENKLAKSESRDPRRITIQETILALCSSQLSVELTLPRRGRRWPAKVSE
jgi:hypothetical protein